MEVMDDLKMESQKSSLIMQYIHSKVKEGHLQKYYTHVKFRDVILNLLLTLYIQNGKLCFIKLWNKICFGIIINRGGGTDFGSGRQVKILGLKISTYVETSDFFRMWTRLSTKQKNEL